MSSDGPDALLSAAEIAPEVLVYGPGEIVRRLRDLDPDDSFARCKGPCGLNKVLSEFAQDLKLASGVKSYCKRCHADRAKGYYAADPEPKRAAMREYNQQNAERLNETKRAARKADPERHRAQDLKKNFKITLADYYAKLEAQCGVCAICGCLPDDKRNYPRNNLAVDHDHQCCDVNGKSCGECIRSLLCMGCNMGNFNDDPILMLKATAYVLRWRYLHGKASHGELMMLESIEDIIVHNERWPPPAGMATSR